MVSDAEYSIAVLIFHLTPRFPRVEYTVKLHRDLVCQTHAHLCTYARTGTGLPSHGCFNRVRPEIAKI
jgi:hypothetical protein